MADSTDLSTRAHSTAHRQIFENLRSQILTGKFAPGTRLPSTRELAATWGSSIFTIHTALQGLVREGWIERRHGLGTFIADPKSRFLDVGIYYDNHFGSNDQSPFVRNLHFSLLDRLHRLKKRVQVFTDPRRHNDQEKVLPEIMDAINSRRIQCLIAPSINSINASGLARLAVPTAFLANPHSSNDCIFDIEQFFRESVKRLVAQGCRSVGLISNVWPDAAEGNFFKMHYEYFRQAVASAAVVAKEEWIPKPADFVRDQEGHGYNEFKKMSALAEQPDGLIAFPDAVVRGVILGVLERGHHSGAGPQKFIFHRNAHVRLLCPFPVTWAVSDEDVMADGIIRLLQRQFDGEKISPLLLPYVFEPSA